MKEIIEALEPAARADFLLDTCFLIYEFDRGNSKQLISFCKDNSVGMSSFNLEELDHVIRKLPGPVSHRIRDFLKDKLITRVDVPVSPGERDAEQGFVSSFDPRLLLLVPDPSDAVLVVLAAKLRADILTRDRHHIFTAVAENYSDSFRVLNKLP